MSALPEIDELKASKRELDKLRQQVLSATNREARLEILAEALRDERDEAVAQASQLQAELDRIKEHSEASATREEPVEGVVVE